MFRSLPTALFALLLAGCPSDPDGFTEPDDDDATEDLYEGDEPGECTDGADNDQDGRFDCDDEGCVGSPDCADDDDTGPDDDDTGPDDDDSVPGAADLVITELFIDPSGDDDSREWIEIFNRGSSAVDLLQWSLGDATGESATIGLPLTVAPHTFVLLGTNDDVFLNGGAPVDFAWGPNVSLDLPEDSISLIDPDGNAVDTVAWDASWNVPSGASLSLDPDFFDPQANDASTAWCMTSAGVFGSTPDRGSPRSPNADCGPPGDDDDSAADDDDSAVDDDDTAVDDDDTVLDDDDTAVDDDDTVLDDDDAVADDDDSSGETCSADAYEPNDALEDAAAIASGNHPALQVCEGDSDWYELEVPAGQEVNASIAFSHAEGNIDLYLRDSIGGELLASTSSSNDEVVGPFGVASTGTLYLEVVMTADAGSVDGNSYSLDLSVGAPGPGNCAPDPLEPNNSAGAAVQLFQASWTGLTICSGDDDWFTMNLPVDDGMLFAFDYDEAEGELSAELRDPNGALVATVPGVGGSLLVSHTATVAGFHTVRLFLTQDLGAGIGTTYALDASQGGGCQPDELEPNSQSAPAGIPAFTSHEDLVVCPGDDWYTVAMLPGDHLDVSATYDAAEGEVDIYLVAPDGTPVASSATASNPESFGHTAAQAGDYLLHVALAADTLPVFGVPYTLEMVLDTVVPSCANGDANEDDDTSGTATSVRSYWANGLSACPSDDDWYAIESLGGTVTVDATFTHAEGNIDLHLFNSSLAPLASATSTTNNESLSGGSAAGIYYLQVTLASDLGSLTGNTYELEIDPP